MKIRRAKLEESVDISKLIVNTITNVNSKDYKKRQMKIELANYTPAKIKSYFKSKKLFVLLDSERIIGVAMLDIKENEIDSLYLNPNFIGKGLGKKLLLYVEKYARKKGLRKMTLYPTDYALDFYKRQGYKIVKEFMGTRNGGYPVIEMEKRLDL